MCVCVCVCVCGGGGGGGVMASSRPVANVKAGKKVGSGRITMLGSQLWLNIAFPSFAFQSFGKCMVIQI